MRHLVLSDIHANLEALDAVIEAAAEATYQGIVVLGDLVGYGADPNGVVDRVRGLAPVAMIRGNHDKVVAGLGELDDFTSVAREAARWTQAHLTPANRTYLAALPAGPLAIDDLVEISHGAPFDEDLYVFGQVEALRSMRAASRPICLFGHTHVPVVFELRGDRLAATLPEPSGTTIVSVEERSRYLINPGSVGQPRDGDPRAAFAIVDTGARRVELMRTSYPVQLAGDKIVAAGLPPVLAQRLRLGR